MPIRDLAAMTRSLDNDYGTTRGPNAADAHQLALFSGDPMLGGLELDAAENPGYARVTITPAMWAPAADGRKDLTGPVTLPAPTDEWLDSATHWGLYDDADGTTLWDCGPLTDPLEVTGASSSGPAVSVAVFYDDAVTEPEDY